MGLFDRLFGKKDAELEQGLDSSVERIEGLADTDQSFEEGDQQEAIVETDQSEKQGAEPIFETADSNEPMLVTVEEADAPSPAPGSEIETTEVVSSADANQSFEPGRDDQAPSGQVLASDAGPEQPASPQPLAEPTEVGAEVASLSSADQHFSAVMADYYAKKEAARLAAEKGEVITFEAMQTKTVEEPVSPSEEVAPAETVEEKYDRTLKKTRTGFGAMLNNFLANFRRVDEEFFEDLEEMLIMADVGVTVATKLTEELRHEAKLEKAKKPEELRRVILEKLVDIYEKDGFANETINLQEGLTVMLFVGVNGVGKTTSIGKLAHQYKQAGKSVMLVAADTFRAGAVAQLVEWGRRVDVPVVTGAEKADPASVVFDGMEKAVAEGVDILLIDTAGRLQNKDNLMAELEKIGRIIKRVLPEAPHETLLALDASTGQNALVQAKEFSKITPLTGLVLTKLDGSAKGGVVLAIREEMDIPVKFIGFGEKIDDIGQFKSEDFMRGLLGELI